MSRGGFGLLFYFADMVEDKKMVDFVKSRESFPVGSGLVFARGLQDRIETPTGEVWLKTGVFETDKTKFDVDFWRKPALSNFVFTQTPIDTSTSAPRVFTQIAMGKANGKRMVLFTTAVGKTLYGSFDDGATIVPVSTDDAWNSQSIVFWYKDRFIIQSTGGWNSMSWDGTTLGAPVNETWIRVGTGYTRQTGPYMSCVDVIGDKLVLGSIDGRIYISNDGVTISPCSAWNDSAEKVAVDTCAIKDIAISKTTDSIAAIGWSSTGSVAFINQVENVFSGVGTVLKHLNTGLTVKDDGIINVNGRWICNIWTWINDPSEKVFIGTLTNTGISSSTTGPLDHIELGDQMLFCSRDSNILWGSASDVFNYTNSSSFAKNAVYSTISGILNKTAVDVEDRVVVSIDANGNRVNRNFGIVAGGMIVSTSASHVRIK